MVPGTGVGEAGARNAAPLFERSWSLIVAGAGGLVAPVPLGLTPTVVPDPGLPGLAPDVPPALLPALPPEVPPELPPDDWARVGETSARLISKTGIARRITDTPFFPAASDRRVGQGRRRRQTKGSAIGIQRSPGAHVPHAGNAACVPDRCATNKPPPAHPGQGNPTCAADFTGTAPIPFARRFP